MGDVVRTGASGMNTSTSSSRQNVMRGERREAPFALVVSTVTTAGEILSAEREWLAQSDKKLRELTLLEEHLKEESWIWELLQAMELQQQLTAHQLFIEFLHNGPAQFKLCQEEILILKTECDRLASSVAGFLNNTPGQQNRRETRGQLPSLKKRHQVFKQRLRAVITRMQDRNA